ncbi:hypothetical protein K458DRAFT_393711 [Lentithecium fluviatile CBS 122367]|uniref:Uncharacterized protein n=1 Tax=Lentithecium fluviatile CBS 122367 TaxID=1168545 RepID=A0A6G1INL4_9PLEO|nr:hypothetical protein K458DRAFT_393711 [Lentithecium fluviatile CBS 122367]
MLADITENQYEALLEAGQSGETETRDSEYTFKLKKLANSLVEVERLITKHEQHCPRALEAFRQRITEEAFRGIKAPNPSKLWVESEEEEEEEEEEEDAERRKPESSFDEKEMEMQNALTYALSLDFFENFPKGKTPKCTTEHLIQNDEALRQAKDDLLEEIAREKSNPRIFRGATFIQMERRN